MEHYAGIDVSLECSSVCVVDASGQIVREAKVASEPEALIAWFGSLGVDAGADRAGSGSAVAVALCGDARGGLPVELLETRHVRDAFKAMPVKTDRNDARGIAQLMRLGWFRPVHCKSMPAQEMRAVLTARKLVQSKLLDIENSLRGILRGFGLKVGKTTERSFAGRIRELVDGHPSARGRSPRRCLRRVRCCCRSSRLGKRRGTLARVARTGQAVDVDTGGRTDRGADLCGGDRRPSAV